MSKTTGPNLDSQIGLLF